MTSLRLGFVLLSSHLFEEVKVEGRTDMAEWRDVEIREIRIDPTPPGKPSFFSERYPRRSETVETHSC